ncbi:MAG: DoxX family protein [Myxococcota bacterium]|nr:DoxX family protein [Myxococcota bacterium]
MNEFVGAVRTRLADLVVRLRWLAPLLGRLAVGLLFMSTGWGKVHNIEKVTHFFEQLGIPAPGFNAIFVGYSELICGTLLVLGLFTRLAAIPLMISMMVAILTAKRGDLHGPFDLVGFDEFTYWVVLAMVFIIGPGAVSIDRLLARQFGWELDSTPHALDRKP